MLSHLAPLSAKSDPGIKIPTRKLRPQAALPALPPRPGVAPEKKRVPASAAPLSSPGHERKA